MLVLRCICTSWVKVLCQVRSSLPPFPIFPLGVFKEKGRVPNSWLGVHVCQVRAVSCAGGEEGNRGPSWFYVLFFSFSSTLGVRVNGVAKIWTSLRVIDIQPGPSIGRQRKCMERQKQKTSACRRPFSSSFSRLKKYFECCRFSSVPIPVFISKAAAL